MILRPVAPSVYERVSARHQHPVGDDSHPPRPSGGCLVFAQEDAALYLSVITIGELRKGIAVLPTGKRRSRLQDWLEGELLPLFTGRILPVTQAIADRWGALSAQRQVVGRPLGMADGILAATALEHSLTMVTRNVRDYADCGYRPREPQATVRSDCLLPNRPPGHRPPAAYHRRLASRARRLASPGLRLLFP